MRVLRAAALLHQGRDAPGPFPAVPVRSRRCPFDYVSEESSGWCRPKLVPAGFPSPADDYVETSLDLSEHLMGKKEATFFVRVAGDSMTEAGIHDGDILVVDRSVEPEDGSVVVAALDGELTVKRGVRFGARVPIWMGEDFDTASVGWGTPVVSGGIYF